MSAYPLILTALCIVFSTKCSHNTSNAYELGYKKLSYTLKYLKNRERDKNRIIADFHFFFSFDPRFVKN